MRLAIGLGQNRLRRRGKVISVHVTHALKLSQSPKKRKSWKLLTGNHLFLIQSVGKVAKTDSKLVVKQSGVAERRRQAGKSHVWHTLTRFF